MERIPCILLYRKVAIVERMLNGTFSKFILPIIMVTFTALQILSGFVSISRYDYIPMPQFLQFPLIWLNIFAFNMLVTTLCSSVNENSESLLQEMTEMLYQERFKICRKYVTRELKACFPLKMRFGNNFIDGGTPLTIQDFVLNQTVSLMLMRN